MSPTFGFLFSTKPGSKVLHCLRSTSAPLLRQIDISCDSPAFYGYDRRVLPARGYIFAGGAPLLTSISLKNIGLRCCLPPLGLVTAMYLYLRTEFHCLVRITCREWMTMILSAPSLIHLEIQGDLVVRDLVPSMALHMAMGIQRSIVSCDA